MIKPRRIGRPPNQPTNHTIYGRWEGAQGVVRPSRRVAWGSPRLNHHLISNPGLSSSISIRGHSQKPGCGFESLKSIGNQGSEGLKRQNFRCAAREIGRYTAVTGEKKPPPAGGARPTYLPHRCRLALSRQPCGTSAFITPRSRHATRRRRPLIRDCCQ